MIPSRLALLALAGGCLLLNPSLRAQAPAPASAAAVPAPFAPDKQFSADEVILTKDGNQIASKVYMDGGKIRTELTTQGMSVIALVLPDEKKIYSIVPAQKMVMALPLDPERLKQVENATGDGATFVAAGTEAVDGTPCTKYKMTSRDGKIFFWWINPTSKVPVKMAADDGSFALIWKNYKAGPQDPTLFQVPAGYQVMQMPGGGGAAGGQ